MLKFWKEKHRKTYGNYNHNAYFSSIAVKGVNGLHGGVLLSEVLQKLLS